MIINIISSEELLDTDGMLSIRQLHVMYILDLYVGASFTQ